jgi:hypothetical protein
MTLSERLAVLPWEVREDLADDLQVGLLCVGLVARHYNAAAAGALPLPRVHDLLATAAARLESASVGLCSQDAGSPQG